MDVYPDRVSSLQSLSNLPPRGALVGSYQAQQMAPIYEYAVIGGEGLLLDYGITHTPHAVSIPEYFPSGSVIIGNARADCVTGL